METETGKRRAPLTIVHMTSSKTADLKGFADIYVREVIAWRQRREQESNPMAKAS